MAKPWKNIKKKFKPEELKENMPEASCDMFNGTKQVKTWINGVWASYTCPKCNGTGIYNET